MVVESKDVTAERMSDQDQRRCDAALLDERVQVSRGAVSQPGSGPGSLQPTAARSYQHARQIGEPR